MKMKDIVLKILKIFFIKDYFNKNRYRLKKKNVWIYKIKYHEIYK